MIIMGEGILLTVKNLNYHKQIYIYIIYYTQYNILQDNVKIYKI